MLLYGVTNYFTTKNELTLLGLRLSCGGLAVRALLASGLRVDKPTTKGPIRGAFCLDLVPRLRVNISLVVSKVDVGAACVSASAASVK